MAFIDDPLNNMAMLRLLGFFVGFFAVIQDIAVDGMAIDILPVDQQAQGKRPDVGFKNCWYFGLSCCGRLYYQQVWFLLCHCFLFFVGVSDHVNTSADQRKAVREKITLE
jgi:hypothetical protein